MILLWSKETLSANKSWKISELFHYCGSGLQKLYVSNHLYHLDRKKVLQGTAEYANLREVSIAMLALRQH